MYLVTEIHDRELIQVIPAATRGEASKTANGLLEEHCRTIGETERYEAYASGRLPETWPPDMALASPEDAEMGSWCNLKGMRFDAHVGYVPDGIAREMLSMLLKRLCKSAMDAPDSNCGDGTCEDCPVTGALALAEAMADEGDPPEKGPSHGR